MNTRDFYWNVNKRFIIDVLNFEFQGEATIIDDSYKNDECPSVVLKFADAYNVFKLYLPSDYKGEYKDFVLMDCSGLDGNEDDYNNASDFYIIETLSDVITKIQSYLYNNLKQ
jgi:hypothetical protein